MIKWTIQVGSIKWTIPHKKNYLSCQELGVLEVNPKAIYSNVLVMKIYEFCLHLLAILVQINGTECFFF